MPEHVNVFGFPQQPSLRFFFNARLKSILISRPMLQKKALDELEIGNFQASSGWLANLKSRHSIKQSITLGESADVDPEVVAKYKDCLPSPFWQHSEHF